MRRIVAFVTMLGVVGCEAALDFGGYEAMPTVCDPVHPSDSIAPRTFVSCTSGEQCGRQSGFVCESAGAGVDSAACTSDTDCAAGLGCDDSGRCHAWCKTAADCGSGHVCDPSASAQYPDGTKLGFCGTSCTLASPTECGGNQCISTATGGRCAGSPGTIADYDACTRDDDCQLGSGCQTLGDAITSSSPAPAVMRCQKWCDTTCASGETCTNIVNGVGFCYAPCDVINPATGPHACASGKRCSFVLVSTKPLATVCEPLATSPLADDNPCSNEAGCVIGDACRSFGHGLYCEDYCDVSANVCPSGRTCMPFSTARTVGGKTYGYCIGATCDPLSGTACGSNQTCTLLDDAYSVCRPQKPTTTPIGQPCTDVVSGTEFIDSCTPTTECIGGATYGDYCRAYCRLDVPSDCATGCHVLATTYSFNGHTWGYCPSPPCDPIKPADSTTPFTACASGKQCRFDTPTTTICVDPTANDAVGATCKLDTDCGSNAFCVHYTTTSTCLLPCRVGGTDCSGAYPKCYAFGNQPYTLGSVEYGYCGT